MVKWTDLFFDDLLREYPEALLGGRKYDCLVKFLDSAIRLPFQVHPTKAFSREHFHSEYGKTEAWLVVATRPGAKLYFGFRDKITKEELAALEERSETEKDIMGSLLCGVEAKPGDIWLIKAGLIHAVGAGCTIIEVQEPTDFTIQPERWCGDYHISEEEEYIGLTKDIALSAINFDIYGNAAQAYARVRPTVAIDTPTYKKEVLISYEDTPCFGENRHTLQNGGGFVMDYAPSVYICLEGEAVIIGEGYGSELVDKLLDSGEYRVSALERVCSVEHVEYRPAIMMLKIVSLHHCQFIEVGYESALMHILSSFVFTSLLFYRNRSMAQVPEVWLWYHLRSDSSPLSRQSLWRVLRQCH